MREILREYYAMKKELSMYICRLKNQLRQVFPQFLPIFSKVNGITAMAVLYEYVTPDAILAAGLDELEQFMKRTVTKTYMRKLSLSWKQLRQHSVLGMGIPASSFSSATILK